MPLEAEQQQAMRDLAVAKATAALEPQPDLLALPSNDRRADVIARRGPGRPPGSRNRRVEDVARVIVEQIGDPLVILAQLAATPTEELMAACGCTAMEALTERRLAAIAVLPFVHQRKPLAVNLNDKREINLTISMGGPAPAEVSAPEIVGIVEYQEVSEGDDGAV